MNKLNKFNKPMMLSATVLFTAILAGCGGSSSSGGVTADTGVPGSVGAACTGTGCVNLGTAANYVIMSESLVDYLPIAIGTTTAKITGNIAASPVAATFITGFSLALDPTGCFSKSTNVTGKLYAADYNTGGCTTPALLTTAVGDKNAAYSAAAALTPVAGCFSGLTGGNTTGEMSGLTITPGVYSCPAYSLGSGNVTLSGAGVYVFKTTGNLNQAAATNVIMAGGALPQNVFWQVAGTVSILANAHMEGVILSATNISLGNLASIKGRLYGGVGAGTGVAMDTSTVTQP